MKDVTLVRTQRRGRGVAKTIGIFALGAATGSLIALLFAPASGSATRKRIVLKLRSARKRAARQIGQARRVIARRANHLRDAAGARLGEARQWVVSRVATSQNGHGRRSTRARVHHA